MAVGGGAGFVVDVVGDLGVVARADRVCDDFLVGGGLGPMRTVPSTRAQGRTGDDRGVGELVGGALGVAGGVDDEDAELAGLGGNLNWPAALVLVAAA